LKEISPTVKPTSGRHPHEQLNDQLSRKIIAVNARCWRTSFSRKDALFQRTAMNNEQMTYVIKVP